MQVEKKITQQQEQLLNQNCAQNISENLEITQQPQQFYGADQDSVGQVSYSWPCIHNYLGEYHMPAHLNQQSKKHPDSNHIQHEIQSEQPQSDCQYSNSRCSLLGPAYVQQYIHQQKGNQLDSNDTSDPDRNSEARQRSHQKQSQQTQSQLPFNNVKGPPVPSYSSSGSSQRENSFSIIHYDHYLPTPTSHGQPWFSGYNIRAQEGHPVVPQHNRSTQSSQGSYNLPRQVESQGIHAGANQDTSSDVFEQYSILTTNDMNDSITSRMVDSEYTELQRVGSGREHQQIWGGKEHSQGDSARDQSQGKDLSQGEANSGIGSMSNSQNATHNGSSNNTINTVITNNESNNSYVSSRHSSSKALINYSINESIMQYVNDHKPQAGQVAVGVQQVKQQKVQGPDLEQESPQRHYGFTQSLNHHLPHVASAPKMQQFKKQQQRQVQQQTLQGYSLDKKLQAESGIKDMKVSCLQAQELEQELLGQNEAERQPINQIQLNRQSQSSMQSCNDGLSSKDFEQTLVSSS